MKLDKKKDLAAKVLHVGRERIVFVEPRLEEIKEAITKEDIRNLKSDGAIIIKEIKAKKSVPKNKKRKSPGNIKKNARNTKKEYILTTRKLRKYVLLLKNKKMITKEQSLDLRKKIRNRYFKNKSQLKEYLNGLKK